MCFIAKPVAVSLYTGMDTCLVVDSGANNTVVTPVVEQRHYAQHAQSKPIGGTHISKWLLQCISMKSCNCDVVRNQHASTN